MDSKILFNERQRFRQWWIWITLLVISITSILALIDQVNRGKREFPTLALISVLSALLLAILRLDTQIKKDGIYIKFFPFRLTFKCYPWNSIRKSYVRQYSALSEYGGWGIRIGFFKKGKAYNISGDQGLQLEFKNGKKLLIGTNKPKELSEALIKLGQLQR